MATKNGNEVVLDSDDVLISETDTKGVIRFANDTFCKVAGYTLDELIGKPHNIVRHKDMPKVAFKDLWDTIKDGKVWKGFVKNSTKDGSFYWVYATIYPFTSCDGSKGYLSFRKKPLPEEIKKAETLYKTLK